MCAIAGIWHVLEGEARNRRALEPMIRVSRHRGPNGQGSCHGDRWAIGHARLSVIDLRGGKQPISTDDGLTHIVGNTEVYNAPELRGELERAGHHFRTHSDTEVVLHGWREWGEDIFARLNGMFSLAIVDSRTQTCILARDPLGIKPLHWTQIGEGYAFASEIKSLLQLPGARREPNRDAVHLFMNFRYLPDDRTLFAGIERLSPGTLMVLGQGTRVTKRFFSMEALVGSSSPGFNAAAEMLDSVLNDAVDRHLQSDVEVGAYLSGGIDSSVVSALAGKKRPGLRTFCLALGEPTDEDTGAAAVANELHTQHENFRMSDAPLDDYAKVLWHVEEPKINCLQGFSLAEQVSKRVRVTLSGLGADELFAGYVNNDLLYPITLLHQLLRGKRRSLSLASFQRFFRPGRLDFFFRAAELGLNSTDPLPFYAILRNAFDHNEDLLRKIYSRAPKHWKNMSVESLRPFFDQKNPDTLNALLVMEMRTKLTNDFLLTEDRVSMAHALEVRVPFLDKELLKHAIPLPSHFKYLPGNRKRILKVVARKWLSARIVDKPKWGFSMNPHLLFEKQLRDVAARELTRERVRDLDLFSWAWIRNVLEAPPSPRMRWHYFNLWTMVGYSMWHRIFFEEFRHAPSSDTGT